ncbi:hypothetical protein PSPO01_15973 [Paraphaeosphaeria sporulosa]
MTFIDASDTVSYNGTATSIANLTTEQASNYRWAYDIWERDRERERNALKTIRRHLMTLKSEINMTIDRRHQYLTNNCRTPYQQLKALRAALAPTAKHRKRTIIDRFDYLKKGPRSPKLLAAWFSEWIEVVNQGIAMRVPCCMEENPQEEFVLALDKIDPEYSRMLLSELTRETRKPNPNIQSLTDYVNDAMVYLRTSNSKYKPHLQTFAAELEAANTDASLDTNSNDNWGNNSGGRGNGRGCGRGGNNGTH